MITSPNIKISNVIIIEKKFASLFALLITKNLFIHYKKKINNIDSEVLERKNRKEQNEKKKKRGEREKEREEEGERGRERDK